MHAHLPAQPFGTRGMVVRAEIAECDCSICLRMYRLSTENVAVSMDPSCPYLQRWASALHVMHAPSYGQEAQAHLELCQSASDYLCQPSCRAPALVVQAASAMGQPANHVSVGIHCLMEAA